jgi:hypothetical protein
MPIEIDSEIRIFTRSEFHELAHRVLGIIFGVHNEFGRLLDEPGRTMRGRMMKKEVEERCVAE